VKLAQISFMVVVMMAAFAIGLLYNRYQDKAIAHNIGHSNIVAMAWFYFLLIAVIRVVLLFVIFKLKFANKITAEKKQKKEEDLWWEPFNNS
jgi:heme/copper-type cytochrome/quinol oxidase subunit 2